MKDRNADFSVGVNIWVPHFCFESHLRRVVGIVVWELELGFEVPSFVQRVFWSLKNDVPKEEIIIVLKTDRSIEVISFLNVLTKKSKLAQEPSILTSQLLCQESLRVLSIRLHLFCLYFRDQ